MHNNSKIQLKYLFCSLFKTLNMVLCARTKIFFHTQSSKLVLWCFTCVHKTKKSFIDFEITTIIYLFAYIVYTCKYKSKKNSENKIILFECKGSLSNSFVQNRYRCCRIKYLRVIWAISGRFIRMMRFVSIFIVSLVLTCVKCQLSCGNNQFACFDGKKVSITLYWYMIVKLR